MHVILDPGPEQVTMHDVDAAGTVTASRQIPLVELPGAVRERERDRPRWVWADTHLIYPGLLSAGVRVERCLDLRLAHSILWANPAVAAAPLGLQISTRWDDPRTPLAPAAPRGPAPDEGLFDLADLGNARAPAHGREPLDPLAQFLEQQEALALIRGKDASPGAAGKIGLLIAAESAGALVAAEMTFAGLPWDVRVHDDLLTSMLGPRPALGERPALVARKLNEVRAALAAPSLNPDSAPDLLRALHAAGIAVKTTRSWELGSVSHPAIAPLLEYKKMARLMSANGWHWIDTWIHDGRFRPVYVPGGVVSGRWASDGGGALQLPHQVRSAVRADPGWKLVVADAAQLEPRILAAMSGDPAMAAAGRGEDMYAAMVAAGAVETREQAKFGMLGAMYGGTSGESGRMLPRLTQAFPRAIALVERAAQAGERGGQVQTWLGRTSPRPSSSWLDSQRDAGGPDTNPEEARIARGQARGQGRFTRNFIVQGTAAEWASTWLATIRQRLHALAVEEARRRQAAQPQQGEQPRLGTQSPQSCLTSGPHLVFFLHDEVMVHTPEHLAEEVAAVLRESAHEAGRLLFGAAGSRVEFPITVAVVDAYDEAP